MRSGPLAIPLLGALAGLPICVFSEIFGALIGSGFGALSWVISEPVDAADPILPLTDIQNRLLIPRLDREAVSRLGNRPNGRSLVATRKGTMHKASTM